MFKQILADAASYKKTHLSSQDLVIRYCNKKAGLIDESEQSVMTKIYIGSLVVTDLKFEIKTLNNSNTIANTLYNKNKPKEYCLNTVEKYG